MARQYSHTQFFRRLPNAFLARYFQEKHDVLNDIGFGELKESEVEPIFKAFTALPDDKQAEIEAELQEVDAMACQGGVTALIDEADFHGDQALPETISKIDGFHGKAMLAFLEHPLYWAGATLFLHSDNIADSSWKKRNDLPKLTPHVDDEDIEALGHAISHHFHSKEGRGRNCKVDVFRRHSKEYFFAYPEDYAQSGVEWIKNSLSTRSRHPAFEIIFVYTRHEGSLDTYAPRNTKSVPDLQSIFAEAILKLDDLDKFDGDKQVYALDDLDKFDGDKQVYALDDLADRDFEFQYAVDSGIESVAVRRLRLSLKTGGKRRVILEADTKKNPKAIYDLMEEIKPPPFYVTQAEIKVTFAPTPGVRGRTRSFKISDPSWCALRHDGRDNIIRKMLADSGIEPMEPEATEDDSIHDL